MMMMSSCVLAGVHLIRLSVIRAVKQKPVSLDCRLTPRRLSSLCEDLGVRTWRAYQTYKTRWRLHRVNQTRRWSTKTCDHKMLQPLYNWKGFGQRFNYLLGSGVRNLCVNNNEGFLLCIQYGHNQLLITNCKCFTIMTVLSRTPGPSWQLGNYSKNCVSDVTWNVAQFKISI